MKIPQNKINDVSKELKKLGWDKLIKINNDPDKWLKVYKHYLELLTKEDVARFWQEQFDLQVASKSDLAIEFGKYCNDNFRDWLRGDVKAGCVTKELFQQFLKDRNNE